LRDDEVPPKARPRSLPSTSLRDGEWFDLAHHPEPVEGQSRTVRSLAMGKNNKRGGFETSSIRGTIGGFSEVSAGYHFSYSGGSDIPV
jgi:hypothetical protein